MDIFRRKKKATISGRSHEDPAGQRAGQPAAEQSDNKLQRKQKRHSISDLSGIGSLWMSKKPLNKELELPMRPHARSVIPTPEPRVTDELVRVSKRRAPGPPRSSPKSNSLGCIADRRVLSSPTVEKTTVCCTEVFQDSHIGHEVTSPASSISGRFLSVPQFKKGSISSAGSSGSVFGASPLGSLIQSHSPGGSVVHESAVYRKPLRSRPTIIEKICSETDVTQSLNEQSHNDATLEKVHFAKSTNSLVLPMVRESSPKYDNFILEKAPTTPVPDYDTDESPKRTKLNDGTSFLSQPLCTWSSVNVVDWCKMKGFNDYAELFEDSDIDGPTLMAITESDLIEMDFDLPSLRPFMAEVEHLKTMRGTPESRLSVEEEVENIRIEYWNNDNVLHWLVKSQLSRFLIDFKVSGVTGVDLVKLDMDMLDGLGIISNQDREEFLARLYETMAGQEKFNRPLSTDKYGGHTSEVGVNDGDQNQLLAAEAARVTKMTSDFDSRTFDRGAKDLKRRPNLSGRSKPPARSGAQSQAIRKIWQMIENHENVALLAELDEEHIEDFKLACEELSAGELQTLYSDIDARIEAAEADLSRITKSQNSGGADEHYEERILRADTVLSLLEEQKSCVMEIMENNKVHHDVIKLSRSSLYDQLFTTTYDVIAVTLHHKTANGHGFKFEERGLNGMIVTAVDEGLPLQAGDRLLELNGYNLSAGRQDDVIALLSRCDWPLRIVVLRPVDKSKQQAGPSSEEEDLREDLMNVMKDLETAIDEKDDLERRNQRMVAMLRGLTGDKEHLQMEVGHLQDQVDEMLNDWGEVCTLLDRFKPDRERDRSRRDLIIQDITHALTDLSNVNKTIKALDSSKLEPVPYETFDNDRPLWESLRDSSKGMVLQALKDTSTETQLRRDLDNRLVSYLLEESPQILARMIEDDRISYQDVKNVDQYLC